MARLSRLCIADLSCRTHKRAHCACEQQQCTHKLQRCVCFRHKQHCICYKDQPYTLKGVMHHGHCCHYYCRYWYADCYCYYDCYCHYHSYHHCNCYCCQYRYFTLPVHAGAIVYKQETMHVCSAECPHQTCANHWSHHFWPVIKALLNTDSKTTLNNRSTRKSVYVCDTQGAVMAEEATLHVVMSGTMAEIIQAVAQMGAPVGAWGSHHPQLFNPIVQAKFHIM